MEHSSPQLSPTTSDPMLSAAMADLPCKRTPPLSASKFHFQYLHGILSKIISNQVNG